MMDQDALVRVGDLIAGKYRVEKVLGMGAMGMVVAAMHVDLQERRALKFMLPSMLGDADAVERFLREARAAGRLKSEHVAKIYDVGRFDAGGGAPLAAGAPYIVMEHLEGSDLKALLETHRTLSVNVSVTYLLQVCEAIAEAHALGIVHRDLKPANLFLTRGVRGEACIKVLDFGIAKMPAGQGTAHDMTATSQLLGTPLYMSPEQMRSTRTTDARSDIWALGVILYRMLTGRTPFQGSSVTEICAAVVGDPPDAPTMLRPDVPPALEAVVMRCLEKSPAKRFASAAELAAALVPFADWRTAGSTFAAPPRASAPAAPAATDPGSASLPSTSPSVPATLPAVPRHPVPGPRTSNASTWTQPVTGAPAAPRNQSVGALVAAGALLVVLGSGAAVLIMRRLDARPAPVTPVETVATTAASLPVADASTATSTAPATAAAPPSSSAALAVSAAPDRPRTAAHAPRATPLVVAPAPLPMPAPPPPSRDAFGRERK